MFGQAGAVAEEPDDRTLLRAHLDGDHESFGLLFRRHRDRLWAVALRTTGDPEEAADALQDGLVSAFRRADSYRGDAAVTTWLHRIVVNACLDRMRRRKVRAAESLPDDLGAYAGRGAAVTRTAPAHATTESTDPADLALDHEQRDLVLQALSTLPTEQRAALVLVDMEGYPVHEAAAILGCATGTVKSRCSRGRARLAPLLSSLHPAGNRPTTQDVPSTTGGSTTEETAEDEAAQGRATYDQATRSTPLEGSTVEGSTTAGTGRRPVHDQDQDPDPDREEVTHRDP
jgi:RNA polymerase sigma-70 factor (ECF subfamily)